MQIVLNKPFGLATAGQVLDVAKPVADEMIKSGRARLPEGTLQTQGARPCKAGSRKGR